jgi:hypothetical protein
MRSEITNVPGESLYLLHTLQRRSFHRILWLHCLKACAPRKSSFYSALFKYDKTIAAVYEAENCVDTLLELLQVYREKPGDRVAEKSASIFTRTCCLLAVLLKTEQCAFVSRS